MNNRAEQLPMPPAPPPALNQRRSSLNVDDPILDPERELYEVYLRFAHV